MTPFGVRLLCQISFARRGFENAGQVQQAQLYSPLPPLQLTVASLAPCLSASYIHAGD